MATNKKKTLEEAIPTMTKNMAQQQYKRLQEEMKFLKERWKSLKTTKNLDEDDQEEKSYIATRWKHLQVEEKKLKSILDSKAVKNATKTPPAESFAKKFSKNLNAVKDAYTFLKSMEDAKYYHSDDMRLKSYHFGMKMGEVIQNLFGNKKDATGIEGLQKALILIKDFPEMNKQTGEANVHDPNGESKYSPGDKLQQFGDGGSLVKKGKDFPEMSEHDNEVNVTDPSNPAKIAKLGEDREHNPFNSGHPGSTEAGHLIPGVGKKDFDVMDEEHNRINLTDPAGPSHYNAGQESMQQFGQGGSLVKHSKSIHDAGLFLKSLAYEKAFGIGHIDTARQLAKALEFAVKMDMGKPFAAEHSEFPGDLGNVLQEGDEHHKAMDEDEGKDEIEEDKGDKAMGAPGMDAGMGGDPGMGMDGGIPGLDDEDEMLPGGLGHKSLDTISTNTLKQSQDILNLQQSLSKLLASLN